MSDTVQADLSTISNELKQQLSPQALAELKNLVSLQAAMSDELIARFARNIEAFQKYMPEIAQFFEHYKPEKSLEFFCAPGGAPNLIWIDSKQVLYNCLDPVQLCQKQVELLLSNQRFVQVHYNNEYDPFGQIHHRYMNESVNVLKKYQLKEGTPLLSGSVPCCMLFGLGLGYVLEQLYSRIEIANLIVVEPDNDMFFASLHAFDWAPLLDFLNENGYGIYLMIGSKKDEAVEQLHDFYLKHGRFLSGFFWNFVHCRTPEVEELAKTIVKDYSRAYSALGFFDDHLFGVSHGFHLLQDKVPLARRDKELPEKIKELPVFVIGNGPSLAKDIPFIRRHQDKALILACGTALETLYRAGIQADIYVATERIPQLRNTLRFLPDHENYLKEVILFASDVLHPLTFKEFRLSFTFSKPDEPFFWLMMNHDHKNTYNWRPILLMNPLVGNFGVSAALNLGFKRVFLFGLDNGIRLDGFAYHPQGSQIYREIYKKSLENVQKRVDEFKKVDPSLPDVPGYDDSGLDENGRQISEAEQNLRYDKHIKSFFAYIKEVNARIRQLQEQGHPELKPLYERKAPEPKEIMEANFGGKMRCSGLYPMAKRHIELICEHYQETSKVFNCSDGVLLENTEPLHSSDLEAEFSARPVLNKQEFRDYLMHEMTYHLSISREDFAKLADADLFEQIVQRLKTQFQKRGSTRLQFTQTLETQAELFSQLNNKFNRFLGFMLDGSMNTFFIMILRALYQSADEEQGLRLANEVGDIYINFLDDAARLFRFLPDYCIGEHQHFTGFKVGYDHENSPAPKSPEIKEVVSDEQLKQVKYEPFVKRYA